jgi:hypothetical protein
MTTLIVCDVDDYIIEWTPTYIKWLWEYHLDDFDTYDTKTWFMSKFINEFNSCVHFRHGRQGMVGSLDFIRQRLEHEDCEILFLSACGFTNWRGQFINLKRFLSNYVINLKTVNHSYEKLGTIDEYLVGKEYINKILILDDRQIAVTEIVRDLKETTFINKIKGSWSHDIDELNKVWKELHE